MQLVMVSRPSLDELEALARKHFSQVPNRHIDDPTVRTPGLTQEQVGQHIYYRPQKDLKQLVLEFTMRDNRDVWRLKPNEYVSSLLSSEENDTLSQHIRT